MATTDPVLGRLGPSIAKSGEAAQPRAASASLTAQSVNEEASPAETLEPAVQSISPEELNQRLEEIVQSLNEQLADTGRNLGFAIDKSINRHVVTVTNRETGELVRQIPSEVVLRVAHNIEELKGVLFDKEI